jgi:D-amino-acid dehydrogenase
MPGPSSSRPLRVTIIGGGVAGAATAFALARKGAQVTLIDLDQQGRATAAGAGIIQPWSTSTDGQLYRLYAAGADYFPALAAHLADAGVSDMGYRRTGALVVNRDPDVLDGVLARLSARATSAPSMGDVSRLDNAAARALFPPLAVDLTALLIPGGARVDGRKLRAALLAGARHHGAAILAGPASLRAPDGVAQVVTDVGDLPADAVVVAAGAWTRGLLQPLGLELDVVPQKGQIMHLHLPGVDTSTWPSVHPVSSSYLVPFGDSRVVVGATRETGSGFDTAVTAGGQQHILNNALQIAPGLSSAAVLETRVGLRPAPGRGLPFLGPVPGVDGLFVNAGFGASGLTMGPYVGELLSDLVLGRGPVPALMPFGWQE